MTSDTHTYTDQRPTLPTELPPLPTPIGAHDYAAQREWEGRQLFEGVWRYQRSRLKLKKDETYREKRLDENEPGQVIASALIAPMVEKIKAAQDEATEALASPSLKKVPDDAWVLLALPAETLAAVTVLAALSHADPCVLSTAAKDVGWKVQHELEMILWRQSEKAAQQARELAGAAWAPNLYDLMHRRNDVVDERVFLKWSKKAKNFVGADWEQNVRLRVGTALLYRLIEADGWFEVVEKKDGFKTTHIFQLTDLGRAFVADRHHQNALARPYMLPMIAEPLDYEYIEPVALAETPED